MSGIGTADVLQRGSQAVPAARWLIFTLASRRRGRPVLRVKTVDSPDDVLAKARQRLQDDDKQRELKASAERERASRIFKADAAWKPVYPALRVVVNGGPLEPAALITLGRHIAHENQLPYIEACKANIAARIEHHLSNECDRRRATCKLFLIEAIVKAAAVLPDVGAIMGLVSEAFSCLAQYNCPVWVIEEFDEIEMDVRERAARKDVSVPARDRIAKQREVVEAATASVAAIQNGDYSVKPQPIAAESAPTEQDERQLWAIFSGQLDQELVAIRDLLGLSDLSSAKSEIHAFCERVTHKTNRIGSEPGKLLSHGWEGGTAYTGGVYAMVGFDLLTGAQASDLDDVLGEFARFLHSGTTAFKQSGIAPDVVKAINCYLSERGHDVGRRVAEAIVTSTTEIPSDPVTLGHMCEVTRDQLKLKTVNKWGTVGRPAPKIEQRGQKPAIFSYSELRPWFISQRPDLYMFWPESFDDFKSALQSVLNGVPNG